MLYIICSTFRNLDENTCLLLIRQQIWQFHLLQHTFTALATQNLHRILMGTNDCWTETEFFFFELLLNLEKYVFMLFLIITFHVSFFFYFCFFESKIINSVFFGIQKCVSRPNETYRFHRHYLFQNWVYQLLTAKCVRRDHRTRTTAILLNNRPIGCLWYRSICGIVCIRSPSPRTICIWSPMLWIKTKIYK